MKAFATLLKCAVTASCVVFVSAASPAVAAPLDELFAELAQPDNPEWQRVESDILREWSKSGSPAMDLLLKRGEQAIGAGDYEAAIEHLTALTDHAPDFPEGWNARATAYFLGGYLGPSLSDIQHTLALEPRHFGALGGLGMILEEMGNEEAALKAYRAARAIHPNRPDLKGAVSRLERALQGTDI
ncbi:tetratricopeptide repeat protein [Ostreiculturibacter nitratireducens]|uniref:tetratricopeptide repeat protein n=1 Tax=Ostreiculturibacter nitratireducens TaxID=3075226 RepID=UPI0031B5F106